VRRHAVDIQGEAREIRLEAVAGHIHLDERIALAGAD
jgi:hypothetical protein